MVTGHAGNENTAKFIRSQKEQLKEALSKPPSQSVVQADFWGVAALRNVVKILFDVEYQSDSSYRLLLKLCGMSFKLPDPFDKRRNEAAITKPMTQIRSGSRRPAGPGAGGVHRRRGPRRTREQNPPHVAAQGRGSQTPRRPRPRPSVILRRTEPNGQENEDLPHQGQPER